MNYYQAREKRHEVSPGVYAAAGDPRNVWHYTVMNDGKVYALGYCAERNCQHKSADEAGDCYRTYIREKCDGKLPGGFDLGNGTGDLIMSSSY